MKTLYLTDSSTNIWVDAENEEVGTLYSEDRYDIRTIYYIEEPMHVIYQSGNDKEEIDAKKGDILIVFYNNRYNKYILDTIRTKQWATNIKNRRKIEQIEKEEWASKNNCDKCDAKCENCCCCDPAEATTAPVMEKEPASKKLKKMIKKITKK